MASSLSNVRRSVGAKLTTYVMLPAFIVLFALSLVMVSRHSGKLRQAGTDRTKSVLRFAEKDLEALGARTMKDLEALGARTMIRAQNVSGIRGAQIARAISSGTATEAGVRGQMLEPLKGLLTSSGDKNIVLFVLDSGARVVSSLDIKLPHGKRFPIPGVRSAEALGTYYLSLPAAQISLLAPAIAEQVNAAGAADVLLQLAVVPIYSSNGRATGSLVAGYVLNGSTTLSNLCRDQFGVKLSLIVKSGIRIASAKVSDEDGAIAGSRANVSMLAGTRYSGSASIQGKDYVASYAPIFAGKDVIAWIEAGLPVSALGGGVAGSGLIILLVLFLIVGSGLFVGRAIWNREFVGPIVHINGIMEQVSGGDYAARASVTVSNEMRGVAGNLNGMLDRISVLLQTEVDRDRLQQQISDLLDIVSSSAEGDLTRRAEVTADVMGALADSFNMMAEDLGGIIREVQSTSEQVGASTGEIVASTDQMAHGAEEQVLQINNAATAIESMAVAISQVAENADAAVEAGRRTTESALKGGEAVAKAMDAMYRIRNTVQQTSDRVKSLGESSQEIGDIVHLIDSIATQTNLLALNAAIEAARAGEAGRGFGVVAEEVRRLADRSTKAANDIATLVQGIQAEVTESVAAMEQGVSEVAEGVELADEAGKALTEIVSVAQQSADLIQEISLSSRQQRTASENVVKQMDGISKIAEQTAMGSQQSATSAAELGTLSEGLRESVSRFRLSE
jgi:methyl-accepting chemotaxis protein